VAEPEILKSLGKKFIAKRYFIPANSFTFPADNFTFPADISFLRILKTEGMTLYGNLNPWQNLQQTSAGKAKSSSNG